MSLWLPDNDVLTQFPDELQLALERYRRVLDGSGYAFWEWGLHDNSYSCGGTFWAKLGYMTVDEAVTCVENVQDYVHPDDFKMVNEVVLNHLRFNTPIDMVYRIRAKDGSYWWTQACASSTRDDSGRVTHLSGVNFDLSHLKDTEKALRLSEARHERILAASNDGIWEWSLDADNDNDNGVFHTSHSCWQHLGYTQEEVDALPEDERLAIWRSYLHPDDLVKMHRALKRHFILKKPFDIEYRMFGHEGQLFWMRSRGQAIFNGKGRAILMSGINIDVTELKAAEERVRKAKDDAEQANNAKSSFLSSMSHELRTPLNAIMGFSQLSAYSSELNEEQKGHSKQIYQAGEHLLHLINEVLDLAQIEAGKVSLQMEAVAPFRIVKECFALVKSLAKQRNIGLFCHSSGYKDYCVHGDAIRLKQCLLNIINNAVKYNVEGGEVHVVFCEQGGGLEISIEDTGEGIPEGRQGELFQAFNRLGAEHTSVEGSGIGLLITKELIEKMQGSLRYCDVSSVGACFKIQLPKSEGKYAATLLEQPNSHHADLPLLDFQAKQSLLYIEDNPSNIQLMTDFLKPYQQIDLTCHADPFVGLHWARSHCPDLIILDIHLPNMSGLELVKLLKGDALTRHLPVIALSANAMPYDIEQGKSAGFDAYLSKPFNMQQLVDVLNRYLVDVAA
ncbi:MAG: PAS domain S-box-containing protein [Kiritimatiellia bacterium]|jgi:PAS domain S-box-containing protein